MPLDRRSGALSSPGAASWLAAERRRSGATKESPLEPVRSTFQVRSYELDSFGHLNHAAFLNYFEQARFDALESCGWPIARILEHDWGIYVVRMEVEYRAEARWGDELTIETWVSEVRGSSMALAQEAIRQDGVLAAAARVTGVWIGSNRKPMRMPPELREALGALGGVDRVLRLRR